MNEVTGWYPYKGTTTLQHQDIATHLKTLFETTKPSQVLEIGTSYGGLTLLIRDLLDEVGLTNCDFRSYDIMETNRFHLEEAIKNGAKVDLRIKNVFNFNKKTSCKMLTILLRKKDNSYASILIPSKVILPELIS